MNVIHALWSARRRSIAHGLGSDERARAVTAILFLFDLGLGFWSANQLIAQLVAWQSQGSAILTTRLWLLNLGTWGGLAFFAVLATLQAMGEGNSPLMTLPVPPPVLFRALYLSMLVEGLANWLVLIAAVMGTSLVIVLGTDGLVWLALLLLGLGVTIWVSMVATLLMVRFVISHPARLLVAALLGLTLAIVLVVNISPALPSPLVVSGLYLGLVLLAVGPLAGPCGELYGAAFRKMEGRDRSRAGVRIPGITLLTQWSSQHRSLAGALFTKLLLCQSRHLLAWGRALVVCIGLATFPFISPALLALEFSPSVLVIAFAAGLALASILEYAPYAISGEGNRFTLYLTAPIEFGDFLQARLTTYLVPVLIQGAVFAALLGAWSGLTISDIAGVTVTVSLVLLGVTTLFVWGSIWDEDLDLAVEGTLEALLVEEIPSSARRIWLLSSGLALFAGMLFLISNLTALVAVILLAALDGVIFVVTGQLSQVLACRLLREG